MASNRRYIFIMAFAILLALFFWSNLSLFMRQGEFANTELYASDMHSYIDALNGIDNGDDYTFPLFFEVAKLFSRALPVPDALALTTALLNALSVAILTYCFWSILSRDGDMNLWKCLLCLVLPYCLVLVSMLYNPFGATAGLGHRYLGVFTPNPWHNHTFMAARPFAIIAFYLFGEILGYYEERANVAQYVAFSISLFLATITKPSFTVVFGSTALCFMVLRLVRSGFSNFKNSLYLGICFLPTIIDLGYQYVWGPFGSHSSQGAEAGIGFKAGYVWSIYSHNIPLAILLALLFPIVVAICNWDELRTNRAFRFGMEMTVVSLLEFLLLYEKGERYWHANFSWGYMYGMFFSFYAALMVLGIRTLRGGKRAVGLALQWVALALHVGAGIGYYWYMQCGGSYVTF